MKTKTNVFVLFCWVRNIYHVVHVLHVVVEEFVRLIKERESKEQTCHESFLQRTLDGAG